MSQDTQDFEILTEMFNALSKENERLKKKLDRRKKLKELNWDDLSTADDNSLISYFLVCLQANAKFNFGSRPYLVHQEALHRELLKPFAREIADWNRINDKSSKDCLRTNPGKQHKKKAKD